MLMKEEEEDKPSMVHDCLALEATEKSLYDVLNNNNPQQNSSDVHFTKNTCCGSCSDTSSFVESNWMEGFETLDISGTANRPLVSNKSTAVFVLDYEFLAHDSELNNENIAGYVEPVDRNAKDHSRVKKNHHREDSDFSEEHRSNKQLANYVGETEPLEMYDNVLLRDKLTQKRHGKKKSLQDEQSKRGSNRARQRGGKIQVIIKDVVDLTNLLMQCAQAVSNFDIRALTNLLLRIRQHSSPKGDSTQRLAHYFANALDVRLAGTGNAPYSAIHADTGTATFPTIHDDRISASDILKGYNMFITASPFVNMLYLLTNKTIMKLATEATTLHIIDFGIMYGFQWPCLIQALSERPGGPPKLRITGIDFPQPGFRPAKRAVNTGRTLAKYCLRFGVPFEYNAIAQEWDTIKIEDLKIGKNELLVVNCSDRLHGVLDDEIEIGKSLRDVVLKLIRNTNPHMFIHAVINGSFNTPFFVARFREALFHFASMFDMLDATVAREDENRLRYEENGFGKDVMNIIACEGTERLERPETYKQWQVRHVKAGFRQVALDKEIVKHVRSEVKRDYHKDFTVEEESKWLLLGWKGRVKRAITCWESVHNSHPDA